MDKQLYLELSQEKEKIDEKEVTEKVAILIDDYLKGVKDGTIKMSKM